MDNIRYIVFYFDAGDLDAERLKTRSGAEIYCVKPARLDRYNEIDMALLNDLHCPVKLVFVGGELAKEAAEKYWSTWISQAQLYGQMPDISSLSRPRSHNFVALPDSAEPTGAGHQIAQNEPKQ